MKEIIKDIGSRVKELRELSDVSTEEIAKELNISENDYISYENGEKDIPVSILYEIANKFKVDMGLLISGEETRMHIFHVTRAGKGRITEKREGYKCKSVSDRFIHKKAETLLVTVEPNEIDVPTTNTHPGQEFNYILEGSLKLYIHNHEIILNEGDSIFFDSTYEHAMKALNNQKSRFLAIII
ncbi:anaerobic benzoate catabolism transcriptional regulator [Methanobrevibacter cuticularis]|uniref:Anaerobic benzoate catabolism transcriptional regulator n=1 Tax=Methanobrevibacter cuticularis TaxID=47311 RepID=A0A166E5S7_9EURY|nr:anaerobic benzoate catabolism transcriptional regulator [Methanobrevibacter cuticularis]